MTNLKELMLKIANDYLGCELSELNHVEQNIIELSIQATTKEIFEAIDKQIEEETGKKIIRFKEIRKEFGVDK